MKYGAAEGKMKENEDIGSSLFSNSCPLLYVPRLRRRGNQLLFSPPPEPSHPFLLSKDPLIEPKARRFLLKTSIEKIQKNLMENHGKFPKISSRALHYIATKAHVKYPPYFSQFFVLDLGSILKEENTLLHSAAKNGNFSLARLLLKKGFQVNEENKLGNTSLHEAAKCGYEDMSWFLIQNGALVTQKNKKGEIPLHEAAKLHWFTTLEELIKSGSDVNCQNMNGETPLHLAIKSWQRKQAEILIHSGANLELKTREGRTPLDMARERKDLIIIGYLTNPNLTTTRNQCPEKPF